MKISDFFGQINEQLGGPDNSGIRGQGAKRPPVSRLSVFPYDRDVSYGQPAGNDRDTSSAGPSFHGLTPKDTEHFSLSLLDLEEIVNEFIGAPQLPSKGDTSNAPSPIPGMGGAWAVDPKKPWDEEPEITDEGVPFDPSEIEPEPVPTNFASWRDQTDDDLENKLDRVWGREDNTNFVQSTDFGQPDFHVISPDPWSVVNQHLSSRGLYGYLPKESAWDRISGMTSKKRR